MTDILDAAVERLARELHDEWTSNLEWSEGLRFERHREHY